MNDTIANTRVEGEIVFSGENIYSEGFDLTDLRRRVGMVFQKPNPFPKSVFENVAFGVQMLRLAENRNDVEAIVEQSLEQVGLWQELKDNLKDEALACRSGSSSAYAWRVCWLFNQK